MNQSKGKIDYTLALVVLALMLFGVVMIASIGVPKSIELTKPASLAYPTCGADGVDCYLLLKNHLFRVLLGFIFFMIGLKVPMRWWKIFSPWTFILSILLLIAVIFAGSNNSTIATAWLTVGNNSLQPSEFAKLGIILYLALWLENKGRDIQDLKKGFIPFCVITGIIILLLIGQPDLGGVMIFTLNTVGMYFLAGAQMKHLVLGAIVALLFLAVYVPTSDYLKYRFMAFINPSEENCQIDASGTARDYCWQTEQANIAVASGGFWGRGLTKGVQKSYWLPQASDDFIFAASAEELGFIRIVLVILAFGFIGYRGLLIAKHAPDRFMMYTATGITLWISGQAFVNIAVNTGVLPVTGITLPFISYGGSSIMATLLGVGVLLNISKYSNLSYAPSPDRRRYGRACDAQSGSYRAAPKN